jgi:hypothetical protein
MAIICGKKAPRYLFRGRLESEIRRGKDAIITFGYARDNTKSFFF